MCWMIETWIAYESSHIDESRRPMQQLQIILKHIILYFQLLQVYLFVHFVHYISA